MKSLGVTMSDKDLEAMIAEVDADGSGEIDFAEFLGLMARQIRDAEGNKALQDVFHLFDAEESGRVSAASIRYVLLNLCEKMTVQEIDALIDGAEKSEDGFLTRESFMKIFEDSR
mmetsp:Transcript_13313/g.43843  ORF Transcript_13313/g.43843 Transcript_13313/m.43843 type:complete len:115 (-) Transcript_13313:87-431(-)